MGVVVGGGERENVGNWENGEEMTGSGESLFFVGCVVDGYSAYTHKNC